MPTMRRKIEWKRISFPLKENSFFIKLDLFSYIISQKDYYNCVKKNSYLSETKLIVGCIVCIIPYVERRILKVRILANVTQFT